MPDTQAPVTRREIAVYTAVVRAVSPGATVEWAAEFLASDNPSAVKQLAMLRSGMAACDYA